MDELQGKYEEYRCLNEEMAFHRENAAKNRNHCITIFAVLAGFAIKEDAPLLFVLAWFIVRWFWQSYNTSNQHHVKISRYVAQYLEGDETGLHWQTRVEKDEGRKISRPRLVWTMFTTPHAVMSLACLLGLIFYLVPWQSGASWMATGVLCAGLAASLNCWMAMRVSNEPWYEMRQKWRDFWSADKGSCHPQEVAQQTLGDDSGKDADGLTGAPQD